MQIAKQSDGDTKVKLKIIAKSDELTAIKATVVTRLAPQVKVVGFRDGKAPLNLIEKQLEPTRLQSEFLEQAVNQLYVAAVREQQLRPVDPPSIEITKFVPFTTLEFTATVDVIGDIKLADYKKVRLQKAAVSVAAPDVNAVIERLRIREAEKQEVTRAAKNGDETILDFKGVDAKTKQPIAGADAQNFPLVLGSNTFIPGFEPELIGLKAGATKTFEITFPKDYGMAALQNRQVSFKVTVNKVNEMILPKLDETFAAKIGPFKSLAELKADIKKQLQVEREQQAQSAFENELVTKITDLSSVALPKVIVDEQLESMEREERQNLAYRGQTWQEHLDAEGVTEERHRERNRPQAEQRVKAGLVLSEIADKEEITVTPEELEVRRQLLKGQYPDAQMQAELDKPDNQNDLLSRLLTEKTLAKIVDYATATN